MDILREYAAEYDFFRIYQTADRGGVTRNFISALALAKGDYVAISDQDDIWERDKIEAQVAELERGGWDMVSCFSKPFAEGGGVVSWDGRRPNFGLMHQMFYGEAPGHTLVFRRELLERLPEIDSDLWRNLTYDIALVIAAAAFDGLGFCDRVLVHQRRYPQAVTYAGDIPRARLADGLRVLMWSLRHYGEARRVGCSRWRARLSYLERLGSDLEEARETKRMLRLNLKRGVIAYAGLTMCFVKNCARLFHTEGWSIGKVVRALAFPVMQMYNYRRQKADATFVN